MKPTNILIITDYMASGGAMTFMRGFIGQLLQKPNLNIHFVSFNENGHQNKSLFPKHPQFHYYSYILNQGYRISTLPHRIWLTHLALKQLSSIHFDLVFTDLVYPTFAVIIAKFFLPNFRNIPIFHHIHGSFSEEIRSQEILPLSIKTKLKLHLFYFLEHFILKHCSKIFVYSQYSYKLTTKLHGCLPLYINKPGIDPSFDTKTRHLTRQQARQKLNLNPSAKYILFTSRIEPRKGVEAFFKHLPTHLKLFSNIQIIICTHFINETQYLYDFFHSIDQLHFGSQVFLINTPSREQLSLLYRAANVTIMPSTDLETFGFSTLESYYYKTPVVAFDIGANPELIPASHLISYSSKNNWSKLYQKINYVINHPDHLDYSQYNYSWKNYIDVIISSLKNK